MGRKLLMSLVALCALVGLVLASTETAGADPAPTIRLNHPHGSYLPNDPARSELAFYTCADPDGDLVSCVGTVPSGTPFDASYGPHTFTVTATDAAGHVTTTTSTYRVHPAAMFCDATALRIGTTEYARSSTGTGTGCPGANLPDGTPVVVGDVTSVLAPLLGPLFPPGPFGIRDLEVQAEGLWALADLSTGGPTPQASSEVGRVRIIAPLLNQVIELSGARAQANPHHGDLDPDQPCVVTDRTGTSSVTFLNLDTWEPFGQGVGLPAPLTVSTPMTIPLGIGTLHLNQTIVTGQVVTQRAVFLDLPGTKNDMAIAEARSGFTCLA